MFEPQSLPTELGSTLGVVRGWSRFPVPPSAEARAAELVGLRRLIDAAEARFTHVLAGFDAAGDGETLHAAASTASWLRGACHLSPGEASSRVFVARAGRDLLGDAINRVRDGRLTYAHLPAMQASLRPLPADTHEQAVTLLRDLAEKVSPDRVRMAGRALRETIDPDGSLREADKQFERRYLHLAPLLDGMTCVEGLLDAEAATKLTTALAPFLVPLGVEDTRTTGQRRADGLIDILETAVRSGELPQLSGATAELQVLLPLQALTPPQQTGSNESAKGGESVNRNEWLTTPGTPSTVPTLPEAMGGSAMVTSVTAQRLSCDASVARVLLDPQSVPVELGRSRRLFTAQQRKLLGVRDNGCRFPDCGRPARHTDAHHVLAWADGGTSDLTNALLLCRFHHRKVHEGGWHIVIENAQLGTNGRVWLVGPDAQRLVSGPRGP